MGHRLPRLEYAADLFSGDPHPKDCPICLQQFTCQDDGPFSEIVLTPCFHVFHACCLGEWLQKNQGCPSCRWDLTDTGEAALRSIQDQQPPLPAVIAPSDLVGNTLVVLDSE